MKDSITKKNKYNQLFYFLGIFLILFIWEIGSLIYNNDIIIPSVFDTFKALFLLLGKMMTYKVMLYTLLRLILVIIISFVIAFIFAILSYWKKGIRQLLSPFILVLKTLPIASIIIIMLIFIGHNKSPYLITGFVIFPIMYEGLLHGLDNIDNDIVEEIKLQTKINALVVKDIYFPLVKSNAITTLLQSFGLGLKVMVMAEFIAQPNYSIGKELLDQKNNLEYTNVFAWTLILLFIVIIFELLINLYRKKQDI